MAGGSAVDPTKPGPWVTWQETSNSNGKDQIFVSKPLGPGMANCNGVTPAGVADGSGNVPAIGGFCFQDVGVQRAGQGNADPSLNVDVNRNGIEPDIAFTGANDSVPWVVWYETGAGGLAQNDLVFAAKAESDTSAGVLGGFHWHVIGNNGERDPERGHQLRHERGGRAGVLAEQRSGGRRRGSARRRRDDEPGQSDRSLGHLGRDGGRRPSRCSCRGSSRRRRRTSRSSTAATRSRPRASTRPAPDITFSGNTPYVTWREETASGTMGFVGSLRERRQPDVRARRERRPADADRRRTRPGRRARADLIHRASPPRSTATVRRARAERWGRRSSCSRTGRARAGCSPTPTSRHAR